MRPGISCALQVACQAGTGPRGTFGGCQTGGITRRITWSSPRGGGSLAFLSDAEQGAGVLVEDSHQRAIAQLGATDAWARNGRVNACSSMNACWTGWSRPPADSPSTVMTGPSTADTGRSQDERTRPPMSTKHAPHNPVPQPNLGPAKPRSWRSTSSNGVSGSQATLRSAPFTASRNPVSIMLSSSRRSGAGVWPGQMAFSASDLVTTRPRAPNSCRSPNISMRMDWSRPPTRTGLKPAARIKSATRLPAASSSAA